MKKLYSLLALSALTCLPVLVNAQCGPSITCPSNITVSNEAGQCGATVTYPAATASTSCTGSTSVYSETFQTGAGSWTLNTSTGTNGAQANTWEVNDSEGGVAPPGCGIASNGDQTLHITCTSMFCGSFLTGAIYNAAETTNKRAESPVFSTVGYSNLTLSFDFISQGDGLNDNASVLYNDGSGWVVLVNSIKSTLCGSGQGMWTNYTVTLPASCNNNSTVRIGFNWTNNNDNVGTDPSIAINNISVTAPTPGTVNITYSQASGTFFPVGTTTVTATATDQNLNTASCNFLVTVSDTTEPVISNCPSDITVQANASNCSATVSWTAPTTNDNCATGLTVNSSHATGSNFPLGTTAVTYTVTDGSGNATTCTFNVTVENDLTAITSATDALCNNDNGTIFAFVQSGTPGFTYAWSPAGGTNAVTDPIPAGIYSCVITDSIGCTITISDTINEPAAITGTQNASICEGQVYTVGANNYNTGGTYVDTLTASSGCDSILTTNLSLLPLPVIVATSTMSNMECEGGSDTLFVSGGASYQWSTGETNDTVIVTHNFSNPMWIVTGTDANGCSSNDTLSTNVVALATISFNTSSIDTLCVDDGQIGMNGLATPLGGTWSGAGVSGGMFAPATAGTGTHMLLYTYENSPGCNSTDSVSVFVDACLGLKAEKISGSVSLYPNPTKGTFTLMVNENFNVEIYNCLGEQIVSGKYNSGKHKISLENEASGIYLVKILKESGVKFVRIVKE